MDMTCHSQKAPFIKQYNNHAVVTQHVNIMLARCISRSPLMLDVDGNIKLKIT